MSDPNLKTLENALRNADQAGDTSAAKSFADQIRSLQSKVYTPLEQTLGNPITRIGLGAIDPLLGAAQLGAHAIGKGEGIDKFIKDLEDKKQKGMEYWENKTGLPVGRGTDIMGMIGGALPFAPLAMAKGASALGRIAKGAMAGGAIGTTAPVRQGKFSEEKPKQIIEGMALGGIVPAVGNAIGLGVNGMKKTIDSLSPVKAVTKYQRKIVGEPNISEVVSALRNPQSVLKGTHPTAAELLKDVPSASPLVAHQQSIAASPGGPSSEFGKRMASNDAARTASKKELSDMANSAKSDILAEVNKKGGVPISKLQADIFDIAKTPEFRASPSTVKALDSIRKRILKAAGKKLKIDAHELYTMRREIGKVDADKEAMRKVQKAIDSAIERISGPSWSQYLQNYANTSAQIAKDAERQSRMYRAPQRTSLNSPSFSGHLAGEMPHIMSRPLAIANAIAKHIGKDLTPKMQNEAAKRYLNPTLLADELEKAPSKLDLDAMHRLIQGSGLVGSRLLTHSDEEQ